MARHPFTGLVILVIGIFIYEAPQWASASCAQHGWWYWLTSTGTAVGDAISCFLFGFFSGIPSWIGILVIAMGFLVAIAK